MTPAAKPYHEPEENDAQIGTLLDAMVDTLDHAVEQAVRHGLEAKVREVFSKHLALPATTPAPPVTTTSNVGASSGTPASGETRAREAQSKTSLKGLSADQLNTILGLFNCVQVLEEYVRRTKPDSPSGKRAASCRDFLRAEIEKLKGAAK